MVLSIALLFASLGISLIYLKVDKASLKAARENASITATVTENLSGNRTFHIIGIKTDSINGSDESIKLIVEHYGYKIYNVGDKISFTADIVCFENSDFDETSYYTSKGYIAKTDKIGKITDETSENIPFSSRISLLRQSMARRILTCVDGDEGALMCAMLLGEKQMLDPHIRLDFIRTGTSHALALSGMHLTVLSFFIIKLLNSLKLSRRNQIIIISAFTVFYMVLTGLSASIVRSGIMTLIAGIGFILGRQRDSVTSLFISVFLIILISPTSVYDIGLVYSALSTFGILVASEFIKIKHKKSFLSSIGEYFLLSLTMNIAATVITIPLNLLYFNTFSIISIPVNIIATPFVYISLLFPIIALIFGNVAWLGNILAFPIRWYIDLTNFFANNSAFVSTQYPILKFSIIIVASFILVLICSSIKLKRFMTCLFIAVGIIITEAFGIFIYNKTHKQIYTYKDRDEIFLCLNFKNSNTLIANADISYSALYRATCNFAENGILTYENLIFTEYDGNLFELVYKITSKYRFESIYLPMPDTYSERDILERISETGKHYGFTCNTYEDNECVDFDEFSIDFVEINRQIRVILSTDEIICSYLPQKLESTAEKERIYGFSDIIISSLDTFSQNGDTKIINDTDKITVK